MIYELMCDPFFQRVWAIEKAILVRKEWEDVVEVAQEILEFAQGQEQASEVAE